MSAKLACACTNTDCISQATKHKWRPCADENINVSVLGAVLGHERQVLQHIQEQLLAEHVRVTMSPDLNDATVIIQFHRMKPRLPADELAGILHTSSGASELAANTCSTCPQVLQ